MQPHERIRYIRKEILEMTLEEFAKQINISRSNLGNIETGRIRLTDRVVTDICEKYGVSRKWIEDGVEPIFPPVSREDEISLFAADIIRDPDDSFRRRLVGVLSQLTSDQWELLADIAEKLAEKKE